MMRHADIHRLLSREVARQFHFHLMAEQRKAPALIDKVVFDGHTPREINGDLIKRVRSEFAGIEHEAEPEQNFFQRWTEANKFHIAYEDFAFEAYNLIFMERISSLREWTDASVEAFQTKGRAVFEKFDVEQEGFSVSFFMRTENNMRELLRDLIGTIPAFGAEEQEYAWIVTFEQSKAYQEGVNEFFEELLNQALQKSEDLLLNILPPQISEELKHNGRVEPVHLDSATVLFTDFKGFTMLAEEMAPADLIAELDDCFSAFDEIIERHGLEKIKTIGDAYMCAGGLPDPNRTHILDTALAALQMNAAIEAERAKRAAQSRPYWEVRIGFHTGPLVAGVIGSKKFSYDIWGDTVNTASRMESSGMPGRVNVSGAAREELKYFFECESRGKVAAKNKGDIEMYFLNRLKPAFSADKAGLVPNDRFLKVREQIADGARVRFRSEA